MSSPSDRISMARKAASNRYLVVGAGEEHAHIGKPEAGLRGLRPELRHGVDVRILHTQCDNQIPLDESVQPVAYVALHQNAIHVFDIGMVGSV
jgi:hypothetical protein